MQSLIAKSLSLAAIAGASVASGDSKHHWSYSGEGGPAHWAELDRQYAVCGTGTRQSPIDIRTNDAQAGSIPALSVDYKSTALHVIDNGHSIQVNVDPGSFLIVGKQRYELVQFHFHHPSEEKLDGNGTDMEAHFVHRDAAGHLAVLAVFLRPGQANAMVESLWDHLPKQKEIEASPAGIRFSPAELLPAGRGYFAYAGSLTTPPCSENVKWFVLKRPRTLSDRQIATFAARYPNNARPIQKLNGRQVLASR